MAMDGPSSIGFGFDWSGDHWMWAFGMHAVFWLLLIALIVGLGFAFRAGRDPDRRPARNDATSVLDIRYARGEIDRAEYLDRKRDLRARPGRG